MARVTHKSTFEKRHIKYGGIEIDKLEEEHFERQIVIEFRLGGEFDYLGGGKANGKGQQKDFLHHIVKI